jgi:hypothetical protein
MKLSIVDKYTLTFSAEEVVCIMDLLNMAVSTGRITEEEGNVVDEYREVCESAGIF